MAKRVELTDKVIAITGAGSGIGLSLTRQCLDAGARVAASDIHTDALTRLALPESELLISTVDTRDKTAVSTWADQVTTHFGGCDAVINNAGISLSVRAENMERDDCARIMDVNFWGVLNGVEAFLPTLLCRPEGHIVNLSSLFGLISVPTQSAYNASKFAVRGYSESLRQELADTNVRVTCVHPGGVDTNIAASGKHIDAIAGGAAGPDTAAQFKQMARTSPDDAARTILAAMIKGKPRVLVGRDAKLLDLLQRLFPASYDRILAPLYRRFSS